jgi:predicted kinase
MSKLILVRGPSGSGKSTLAELFDGYIHLETDRWFMVNGEYKFDPDKLSEYHEQCQEATMDYLRRGHNVVVANTFTRLWELDPYFRIAERAGATVQVITCHGTFKNSHGVPDSAVARMRERFEYDVLPLYTNYPTVSLDY